MPSRYLCDVLDDMRKMHETRNYSGLLGSIEQAQVMASRMEAALGDKRTIEKYDDEAHRLNRNLKDKRDEIKKLTARHEALNEETARLEKLIGKMTHEYNKETKGGTMGNIY